MPLYPYISYSQPASSPSIGLRAPCESVLSHPLSCVSVYGEVELTGSHDLRLDSAPDYLLFCVLGGEALLEGAKQSLPLPSDSLLLLPPYSSCKLTGSSCRALLFMLHGQAVSCFGERLLPHASDPAVFSLPGLHRRAGQVELFLSGSSAHAPLLVYNALLALLAECLYAPSSPLPGCPEPLAAILESRYREPLTLDRLAAELGVSKYHLSREFSRHMGISLLQYLNQKRLLYARELLISTEDTVHSVGSRAGIPNTTHFISLFKRAYGCTPAVFRELNRQTGHSGE